MEGKVSLYDLLARLVPGGFLLWCLAYSLEPTAGFDWPKAGGEVSSAATWFVLAYVVGLVVNQCGEWMYRLLQTKTTEPIRAFFANPSRTWLTDCAACSESERKLNRQWVASVMGEEVESFCSRTLSEEESHAAFRQAIAISEDGSTKLQSMQAQYGLHRNLMAACLIATVACLALTFRRITDLRFGELGFLVVLPVLAAVFACATRRWSITFVRNAFELAGREIRKSK